MPYSVKILADSLAPNGKRLTTWELTYPRFVHAELMTHRLFSRNSASSRAIPVEKMIARVKTDPAMPVWWGKNQPGMQAREEIPDAVDEKLGYNPRRNVEGLWLEARDEAVKYAQALVDEGLHKQIANRILEPWMFITVILSATEVDNWFRLRCHPDAQPEIGWVAREMQRQYHEHTPRDLAAGEWHLPMITEEDRAALGPHEIRLVSVARCARVSYLTHDGRRDYAEDVRLAMKLQESGHWSPFEHVAQAMDFDSGRRWSGNFCGWRQYRQDLDLNFTRVGG